MSNEKVYITGSLPPPIGGVTVFIKYFIEASAVHGREVHFFSLNPKHLAAMHNSFLIINSSNNIKRCIFAIIGRLLFKKVFFVKHGGPFNLNNPLVRIAIKLVNGVFCLNQQVQGQLEELKVNYIKHSTVFSENKFEIKSKSARSPTSRKHILLYINNDSYLNNAHIYGADFVLACMDRILNKYDITVIDLSGKFEEEFSPFKNTNYISEPVDFKKLLSEVDIYIRPTRSDGMSVALLEAGLFQVACLASDVVERPDFVMTYELDNRDDFLTKLDELGDVKSQIDVSLSSISEVFSFMSKCS